MLVKVVTKVVANRLKALMPKLTSKNQCSFILGRHTSDNSIIAQEIIHSVKRKKGKSGWLAVKIDLEKAYDSELESFGRGPCRSGVGTSSSEADSLLCYFGITIYLMEWQSLLF